MILILMLSWPFLTLDSALGWTGFPLVRTSFSLPRIQVTLADVNSARIKGPTSVYSRSVLKDTKQVYSIFRFTAHWTSESELSHQSLSHQVSASAATQVSPCPLFGSLCSPERLQRSNWTKAYLCLADGYALLLHLYHMHVQ